MKKLGIYIVATASCFFSSCLDTELYTTIPVDDFFKTEADAQAYLNGVYGGFRDRSARCYIPAGEYAYQMLNEVAGANLIFGPGAQKGDQLMMEKAEWGVDFYVTSSLWMDLYMGISRANIGIDNLKKQPQTPALERFIAETRVIRAYFYADLVYLYGDVPFITTSNFDLMSKPGRTSKDEVIKFCIDEVKDAMDKLPDSYPAKEYGRFTKWGAKAKLCKIYLEAKMWKECAEIANEIITQSPHRLIEDYSKLWGVENEKNAEFLFVIPSLPPRYQHSAYAAHFQPADFLNPDGTVIGWDYYRATWEFYNSFDPADKRRADLLTSYKAKVKGEIVVKEVGHGIGEGPIPNKFPLDPAHIDWTEGTDVVLLRLADIILARAEALNELNGPSQEAVDLINKIRERAFGNAEHNLKLADYPSKDALRAAILQERSWELFLEGYNRMDLIRHGVYIETMKKKGSTNVSTNHLLLPIPQSELNMNPNLTQNPY
ncbi:RagB/SusD family nutrient uptake outer membrane protein [Phocaeicola vulgatus]|uniref:RagB/SusD family nutrient uptake outer membrane protein n=1 Tax=Phocaeicola vulgatus TaxID=821 RepID=UPI000E430399|nr:RagB/SusD family nutrient uptake outer membrane protein [Phocaeicola vulgatus]RGM67776.1 RagB/SusD family nutrient uptake outer membrane protein [Phocaeicola vulgatus]RGM70471.1 RagB/SusD family nutrient uptake outer membrane protein [Phocaeicola vulgatus]RGY83619.1 RagB/SusD family nutrient uptake outer membrane protein [Phocaeicola vulgatus]